MDKMSQSISVPHLGLDGQNVSVDFCATSRTGWAKCLGQFLCHI